MGNGAVDEGLSGYPADESLLVWDNDGGDLPDGVNGCEHFVNASLQTLGYSNVTVTSQGENLTSYNLSNYTVVFALIGMAPVTGNISGEEETALTDFLDDGGRLYIEGGDVGFQANDGAGSGEFSSLWPYLKANYVSNGASFGQLNGTASLFTDDMQFDYSGNDTSMDVLSPAAGAFSLFENDTNATGIAHNGSYRTVCLSFQFGGLSDGNQSSTRDGFMARTMHFFSYELVRDISVVGDSLNYGGLIDFEGDSDMGWTHRADRGNDVWQRGVPSTGPNAAHSGDKVWATNLGGNYPDQSDFSLYVPPTNIAPNTELVFWHWYTIEGFFDDANVEIFDIGANRWVILANFDGQSGGWVEETVRIPPQYFGEVDIRFRFVTDVNVNFEGWYIDDVEIPSVDCMYKHMNGFFVGNEKEVVPSVTVENSGNMNMSFPLMGRVYYQGNGTVVYNQTVQVNLTPDERKNVSFPVTWNTSTTVNVTYVMEFSSLAPEENGSGQDNSTSVNIYVGIFEDLKANDIFVGSIEPVVPGDVITPKGDFVNLGNANITGFTASLKITDGGSNVFYWANVSGLSLNLSWGNNTTVELPQWTVPNGDGDYLFNLTHDYGDKYGENDRYERWVRGEEYYDISVNSFHFNVSLPLNSSKKVTLVANITNWGNMNATNVQLRCVIYNSTGVEFYNRTNNTITVNRPMGNTTKIPFTDLVLPSEEGNMTVEIDVLWNEDENVSNDHLSDNALIDDHHDIGLVSSDSVTMAGDTTYGYYKRGVHQVTANVTNYGNVNHTPVVDFQYAVEEEPRHIFYDDMENGEGDWLQHDLNAAGTLFHIVQPNSQHNDHHSPDRSWWFGDEQAGNYVDGQLEVLVQRIDLTNESEVYIDFWHNYKFHANNDDAAFLVYDTELDHTQANYFIIETYQGTSNGWENRKVDITQYCGQEILLGFAIRTLGGNTVDKGWYVDDVSVNAPNHTVVDTQRVVGQEIAPGESTIVTDNYDFDQNVTYYILPKTVLAGDENSGNNLGLRKVDVKDFPDPAMLDIDMTGGRITEIRNDFEDDDGGFVASGMNTFEWGTPSQAGSPTMDRRNEKCWAVSLAEEYRNDLDIALTARLDLRNYTGAMLSFEHWFEIEEFNDGVWLEMRNESSVNYFNISPIGGYPSSCRIPQGWPGFPGNIPAFSSISGGGLEPIWETAFFNLSKYVGSVADIRFRFLSDNAIIRPGWFMDNLHVYDPVKEAKYRVNKGVNCVFSFDYSNFGNIITAGGTGELTVEGITDVGYSFTDSLALANVAPDARDTKTFGAQWTSPNTEGFYRVTVNLTSAGDLMLANSVYSMIVEVQDSHSIQTRKIANPVNINGYAMGSEIQLQGIIRNDGTHDETGIAVEVTIVDTENDSWTPEEFSTAVNIKVKHSIIVPFTWTVPDRLGATYLITYRSSHVNDENGTDNAYSVIIYALPEDMDNAVFGFVRDNTTDSPYYSRLLPNVSVALKVTDTGNVVERTTTDENGFYSLNLTARFKGLDYTLQFSRAWYHLATADFFLLTGEVYKISTELHVDNLRPRAVLDLPLDPPYYILEDEVLTIGFDETTDADRPDQDLVYRLESDISGLLYEGTNGSFTDTFEPGVHLLTLTVTDEMGGNDSTTAELTVYGATWNEYIFDDAALVIDLLSAGPGSIAVAEAQLVDVSDDLLDMGYRYNIRTEGVIKVLGAEITVYYLNEDLRYNAREDMLRFYRFDHLYPDASWEAMNVTGRDVENNSISTSYSGSNRTMDMDVVLFATKDSTPPFVIDTVPGDGATDVSVFTPINVTFSENIRFSQLGLEDVVLREGGSDALIDMEYNDTTHTLFIIPRTAALQPKTKYTVTVEGIYDMVYNEMDKFIFSFITGNWIQTNGTVSGFVKDESRNPIPDVRILVDGEEVALTDGTGYYSFSYKAGAYSLTANGTGYLDSVLEGVDIYADRIISRSFILLRYVHMDVTLVTGRVAYADEDGDIVPLKEVLVKFDGIIKTRTDDNGEFAVSIEKGTYIMSLEKNGYATHQIDAVLENDTFSLNITLRRMDFAVIAGRIIGPDNLPLSGVNVTLEPKSIGDEKRYAETDSEGRYYVEVEADLSYTVTYMKVGYETFTAGPFRLEEGEEMDLDLHIMIKTSKVTDDSSALDYWPWILLVMIIGLVVVMLLLVLRPKKESEDDFEEQTGPVELPEAAAQPADRDEPTVIARPEETGYEAPGPFEGAGPRGPPGPPPLAGDREGIPDAYPESGLGLEAAPGTETATGEPAIGLPGMEEHAAMGDGIEEERLALPPGPEEGGAEGEAAPGPDTTVEPTQITEPSPAVETTEMPASVDETMAAVPAAVRTDPEAAVTAVEPAQVEARSDPVTRGPPGPPPVQPVPAASAAPAPVQTPKKRVVRRKVVKKTAVKK